MAAPAALAASVVATRLGTGGLMAAPAAVALALATPGRALAG